METGWPGWPGRNLHQGAAVKLQTAARFASHWWLMIQCLTSKATAKHFERLLCVPAHWQQHDSIMTKR